ncbi:MAG: hypothetical protein RI957_121 [Verrucomicrobiota bacterium]|jgi:hypothetical protein
MVARTLGCPSIESHRRLIREIVSFPENMRAHPALGEGNIMIGAPLQRSMLLVQAVILNTAMAGPYDAAPLRTNLSAEPYCRTEEGRTNKRFSDGDLNQYRIYDFYRRQAMHHLKPENAAQRLLPPYPGLDGGRRGHWGATNEKTSSQAVRATGPEFTRVTSRAGSGELLYRIARKNDTALIAFDTRNAGLRRFFPSARLCTEEHPFGLAVDRFGMRMKIDGTPVLRGADHEWGREGQSIASWRSYAWENNRAVFCWEIDGTLVKDQPELLSSIDDKIIALQRRWDFTAPIVKPLQLHFPQPVIPWDAKSTETRIEKIKGSMLILQRCGKQASMHHVGTQGQLRAEVAENGSSLSLQSIHAGDQLRLTSWIGHVDEIEVAMALLKEHPFTQQNQTDRTVPTAKEFSGEIIVKGHLNADPEARGSDYEIDDIPVPFTNPDRAPMTISGIGFDETGIAYVCTLVGDVWRVTGLHGDLTEIRWQRFAAGLDLPMGLAVVGGKPHVHVRHHLIRLSDRDQNGEADHYERVNRMILPNNCENGRDLRCDSKGDFIFNTSGGIYRLSADGEHLQQIGQGARNPLGIGVRSDGLTLSDSSEGNLENGTCTIFESDHPENEQSVAKHKRLIYLPRGIDNSPGSRLFLADDRFGPLGRSILGVSFGNGTWYTLLRDVCDGTPQAMLIPHSGIFRSGACRVAQQTRDGQVFVAGLDGWGDYGVEEGCLHRIRYTGKKAMHVTGWRAHRNGILLSFNKPLGRLPDASQCFVQEWNYIDSPQTYGSAEYSVKKPDAIGHDRLQVETIVSAESKNEVFIAISDLLPAMCLHLHLTLLASDGSQVPVDVYATVQRLRPDAPWGKPTAAERPVTLSVPTVTNNGDTYQKIIEHFDRLAGREIRNRAVTSEVTYRVEDLNYPWIRKNLLETHCLMCHGPGTQHDYSTYEGLISKIRPNDARRSMLYGMIQSGSMPPYPLPSLSPSLQKAVLEWIQRGAPR